MAALHVTRQDRAEKRDPAAVFRTRAKKSESGDGQRGGKSSPSPAEAPSAPGKGKPFFAADTLIITGALAVLATIADMIRETTGFSLNPAYIVHLVMDWVALLALFRAGSTALDWLAQRSAQTDDALIIHIPSNYRMRSLLKLALVIGICWLPWIILTYPGVIWYDARQQLLQFFGLPNTFTAGALSDHHPVFDTLLYGLFISLGRASGSADAGAFLFCVFQAFAAAAAMASGVILARRVGATSRTLNVLLAVTCFFPHLPLYASAMAKDATFLPGFIFFSVASIEIVRSRGACLGSARRIVAYVALALIMSLTRKTGLIMVLIIVAVTAACVRGRRARAAVASAGVIAACVMVLVMPGIILPALGAKPGGSQEALGLLFQQSARLLREQGNDLPAWQRNAIEDVLGEDAASNYSWWITDTVKDPLVDTGYEENLPAYICAWAAGLVDHPLVYLKSYLAVQTGWYAMPAAGGEDYIMYGTPIDAHEMNHRFEGSRIIGFSWRDTTVGSMLEDIDEWVQSTPVGALLLSKAFWSTWMLAFCLWSCRRRAPRRLPWLAPLVAANLVLWISPTSVTREAMRYLLPLLFIVPLSLALVAVQKRDAC